MSLHLQDGDINIYLPHSGSWKSLINMYMFKALRVKAALEVQNIY